MGSFVTYVELVLERAFGEVFVSGGGNAGENVPGGDADEYVPGVEDNADDNED